MQRILDTLPFVSLQGKFRTQTCQCKRLHCATVQMRVCTSTCMVPARTKTHFDSDQTRENMRLYIPSDQTEDAL